MIKISEQELGKWRVEITNAEKFRDEQLGKNKFSDISGAGENIEYFETGISGRLAQELKTTQEVPYSTINVIFPIVKNIIPTLYWKNPYINALPKRQEDEDSVTYAAAILNYYYDELDIKSVNRQIIFDAYVIGMGICKIGYSTQFGSDIPDENLEKNREKEKKRGLLEKLGLKKPKVIEETTEIVDFNEYIRSESPYITWVSPFEFGIDPTANSIHTARYVFQKITKILKQVKDNKGYSNTSDLKGTPITENMTRDVPDTQIDNFKTIDIYEIHYKGDDGIYILTLAKDGNNYKALRHDKSIYHMDGFQFEILSFNKHNHKLYPIPDINIIKGLQDRINTSFENILEQVDKYVPKIFVDETALTVEGSRALRDGNVGAIVNCNKNPTEVVKEASFVQLKGDMVVLVDKLLEIVMLETGLTKAQLMGMSSAQTATEAQLEQGGQNLRLSDKFDLVADFASKQARKLWQVVQQFVDLDELQLIVGERGIDDVTGLPKFSWLPDITSEMSDKLSKGEYRFKIDVTSIEKPDLPILRQQIERIAQLLIQDGVIQTFQMQGYKIELAEFAKAYLKLFPYVFIDIGKIIKPITQNTQGLMPPQQPQGQQGGPNNMANMPKSSQAPNMADIISSAAGEKGQVPGPIA